MPCRSPSRRVLNQDMPETGINAVRADKQITVPVGRHRDEVAALSLMDGTAQVDATRLSGSPPQRSGSGASSSMKKRSR